MPRLSIQILANESELADAPQIWRLRNWVGVLYVLWPTISDSLLKLNK